MAACSRWLSASPGCAWRVRLATEAGQSGDKSPHSKKLARIYIARSFGVRRLVAAFLPSWLAGSIGLRRIGRAAGPFIHTFGGMPACSRWLSVFRDTTGKCAEEVRTPAGVRILKISNRWCRKLRSTTGYKRPSLRDEERIRSQLLRDENEAVIHVRQYLACLLAYRYARVPDGFSAFGLALTLMSRTRQNRLRSQVGSFFEAGPIRYRGRF